MITLGLVRHGTTDWNATGRLQGQNDIPLNETGKRQAMLLGSRLKLESWDMLVSSDLSRARMTAELIAKQIGISSVATDPRLRERTHGRLDGTTLEERIAKWGPEWKTMDHGVESDEMLFDRGMASFSELAGEHMGKRILVVTHGAFIGVLLNRMLRSMPEGSLQNTSLSIVEQTAGGWECRLFNCTAHLTEQV